MINRRHFGVGIAGIASLLFMPRPVKAMPTLSGQYVATLSQAGSAFPTAVVHENTLGGTLVWSYNVDDTPGHLYGTLAGAFTNKSVWGSRLVVLNGDEVRTMITLLKESDDRVVMFVQNINNLEYLDTPNLSSVPIAFRVYD